MRRRKAGIVALAIVLVFALAAVIGTIGCGGEFEGVTTTAPGSYSRPAAVSTTAAPATTVWRGDESDGAGSPSYAPNYSASGDTGSTSQALGGTLTALEVAAGQKVISDAQVEIEVEAGMFQNVFSQALLLADRYGGYLVSSNSYASGDDGTMKTGTVAIRVPSTSFAKALDDAGKLGSLKSQNLSSQDVTEEYVDLQARIKNSEAYVNSLEALLAKAKTVDEILQVQSVLTYAQQDLEQLKGRLRFLDEHTSYSTITMSIFEKGTEPVEASSWGVGGAFKDALHYLVRVFNGIVRGLGVLIPVLIVVAIVAYIIYRIVATVVRRNRRKQQMTYQQQPQGWHSMPAGPVQGQAAQTEMPAPGAAPGAQIADSQAGAGGAETKK
jgi:hypothetical protein